MRRATPTLRAVGRVLQICLNELGRRMDIDLVEETDAGANKAMWRVCGNDDDTAGANFARVITYGYRGCTFQRKCYLDVRMRV